MEEEKIFDNIEDVVCPYCGNPVNWKHFSHWMGNDACFIAECWSGDINKDAPRHVFKIWITIDKEVKVQQKKEAEEG